MRKVTLIILTILLSGMTFGQEIGFRGGLNFAKTGGDSENVSFKSDLHIGLFWSDYLRKKLVYYFDATYSRQGGQIAPSVFRDWVINNNYINLNSLIGFETNKRLIIFLGPQIGIRLNGRFKSPEFLNENTTSDLSLFNFSLTSELQYRVGKIISLYSRYSHGLTSNISQDNTNTGKFPDRVIQIGIAVNVGNKRYAQ